MFFLTYLSLGYRMNRAAMLSAVANPVAADAARRKGYKLGVVEHLRFGLPLTLITLLMAYLWIYC